MVLITKNIVSQVKFEISELKYELIKNIFDITYKKELIS